MSAGSPRPTRSHTRNKLGQTTVSPQQVTDASILDSVAGFINEVATYNVPIDTKDQIQWVRFENFNCDTPLENEDGDSIPIAIVLILGYTTGIQIWAIPANGEAVELLSWRHGSVRVLRFLPSPYKVGCCNYPKDIYVQSRPLIAICDTTSPGPHYCALSFISLKTGDQVKVIKFKNQILDILTNQRSVVVTFTERIAVFDAFTLEDRLTVTTCYVSPGIYPNPIALGIRWLAYAEKKLISNKRSNGGNEGEGVQSYTATVLHAAKSLGKGLRELGETVASSLTGNPTFKPGSPGTTHSGGNSPPETIQKGVVTVLDIENKNTEDGVVAHFAAHSEAIVCLCFDPTGMLLLTSDKRGHDFHIFRVHPHPAGSALAAVHHLYILHRGDTTARVQDMCFSPDSRWVAVSTLRGTTHVFPITPYGGNVGYRTHGTPFVVNRMSRFHRSAGLPVEGRSNSPVSLSEAPVNSSVPYSNPRLAPYPHPTVIHPLAQIRQPLFIQVAGNLQHRPHAVIGRPRLNSSSEDNIQVALRISACFASARAWFDNLAPTHETLSKQQSKPMESLFIMSCHGNLIQYDLDPHQATAVTKEKKCCDESPIELTIQAKAQWTLQRQSHWNDALLPVNTQNLSLLPLYFKKDKCSKPNHMDDRWLSQVEIVTHAGPHRRLWMGPQFTFKIYTNPNGSPLAYEGQSVEVGHSKPVNMPSSTTYPILIESGSTSSCEQSPKLLDTYHKLTEVMGGAGELQLKEDLADAMQESPGFRETGGRCVIVSMKPHSTGIAKVVNPLGTVVTIHSDDDTEIQTVEEAVIHENCDEALFRPVVAPKPLHFVENKLPLSNKSSVLKTRNYISEPQAKDVRTNNEEYMKNIIDDSVEEYLKMINFDSKLKSDTKVQCKLDTKYQYKNEIKIDTNSSLLLPKKSKQLSNKHEKTDKLDFYFEELNTQSESLNIYNVANENLPPKMLITTPDLMDAVEDFSFSSNSLKIAPESITFSSFDELAKEDNFEDARDSPDVTVKIDVLKSNKKHQGLELEDIVSDVVELKNAKKIRKPKTKLGVRLSNKGLDGFEKIEKENDANISIEINLPAPKKTWSSIVGSKPIDEPILDIPELEQFELPVVSYSTATKKHLVEINPNEDTTLQLPDKISKTNDIKLSDDEKPGNASSQNETTESDDSAGKVIVMDTEEDHWQLEEGTKTVQQGPEKILKRKSKRKKK